MNHIPIKSRLKELVIDYLIIIVYLVVLFMINLGVILIYFKKIPVYSELQSQLIATLTSVVPIILIFSYLDYYKNGSIGKRVSGLTLIFKDRKLILSIYRNIIKFLPWQLGHIGVIHGMYTDFNLFSILIAICALIFGFILLYMGLFRKDKRHLGDLLAGTKVELKS